MVDLGYLKDSPNSSLDPTTPSAVFSPPRRLPPIGAGLAGAQHPTHPLSLQPLHPLHSSALGGLSSGSNIRKSPVSSNLTKTFSDPLVSEVSLGEHKAAVTVETLVDELPLAAKTGNSSTSDRTVGGSDSHLPTFERRMSGTGLMSSSARGKQHSIVPTTVVVACSPAMNNDVQVYSPLDPSVDTPVTASSEKQDRVLAAGDVMTLLPPNSPKLQLEPRRRGSPFRIGDTLSVCLITWNLEGTCGPDDMTSFVTPGAHDLVAIGTEECERGIAASYLNPSKDKWVEKLVSRLGEKYVMIASHTLMAIHLIVFAIKDVACFIKEVQTQEIATGLLNGAIGNKGGVGVCFLVGPTSFLFVNAHFAASQEKVWERNNNYKKMVTEMTIRTSKCASRCASPTTKNRGALNDSFEQNPNPPTKQLSPSPRHSAPASQLPPTTRTPLHSSSSSGGGMQTTPRGTTIVVSPAQHTNRSPSPGPAKHPQQRGLYITPTTSPINDGHSTAEGTQSSTSVSSAVVATTTTTTTTTLLSPKSASGGGGGGGESRPTSSISSRDGTSSVNPANDATECFDVVFWMGDLNYRIDGSRRMVDVILKDETYREVLLSNDQLLKAIRKGDVFHGFKEGPILFRPTYKYHKENGRATEDYDMSAKTRIPAWTDRILYKTNPPFVEDDLCLLSYSTLDASSLWVSDHRPVSAQFLVKTPPAPASSVAAVPSKPPPATVGGSKACVVS